MAAVLAVTALLAGFVPVRAELLAGADGGRPVASCGSVFFPSEHSGDDGCEIERIRRAGLAFFLPPIALVVGGIGLVVLAKVGV